MDLAQWRGGAAGAQGPCSLPAPVSFRPSVRTSPHLTSPHRLWVAGTGDGRLPALQVRAAPPWAQADGVWGAQPPAELCGEGLRNGGRSGGGDGGDGGEGLGSCCGPGAAAAAAAG